MKKLVVLLLALTMLFSCAAISVGAEDKIIESGGKQWKVVSEDLLYNSGLGDPATVEEEGMDLNNGNWFGHES